MIDLHCRSTPNGKKAATLLEECGLAYRIVPCNIGRGDRFAESSLKICPNDRMPAIADREPADGGAPPRHSLQPARPPGAGAAR